MKLTEADASRKLLHFDENQEPNSPSGPKGRNAFNRSSPDQPNSATPHDALSSLMSSTRAYDRLTIRSDNTAQRAKDNTYRESLARQATRNWKPGDIYAPHDLSPQEMVKWKQPKQPSKDIIDMLGLNPLDHYRVRGSTISIFWWRWFSSGHTTLGDVRLRADKQGPASKSMLRAVIS